MQRNVEFESFAGENLKIMVNNVGDKLVIWCNNMDKEWDIGGAIPINYSWWDINGDIIGNVTGTSTVHFMD